MVAAAEQHVQPTNAQAFAVAIKPFIDWVQRYGVIPLEKPEADGGEPGRRRQQIADIVSGYREDLGDLPTDVLCDAVKKVVGGYRYNSLPKPGDFRAVADAEMRERNNRLRRLRTAAIFAERVSGDGSDFSETRERTPDQIAAASRMAEQVRSIPVEIKPVPARKSDQKPEDTDTKEAVRRVMAETSGMRRIPKPWEGNTP